MMTLQESRKTLSSVIPAETGIQNGQGILDTGLRRGESAGGFLRIRQTSCPHVGLTEEAALCNVGILAGTAPDRESIRCSGSGKEKEAEDVTTAGYHERKSSNPQCLSPRHFGSVLRDGGQKPPGFCRRLGRCGCRIPHDSKKTESTHPGEISIGEEPERLRGPRSERVGPSSRPDVQGAPRGDPVPLFFVRRGILSKLTH